MEKEIKQIFLKEFEKDLEYIRNEAIELGENPKSAEKSFIREFLPVFIRQQREAYR